MNSLRKDSLQSKQKKRRIAAFAILFAVLLTVFLLGILFGSTYIPLSDFLRDIGDSSATNTIILTKIRLPRVFAGLFAGLGLAIAGCVLQSLMHNDLVSPNTIGISSGAGFVVVLVVSLIGNLVSFLPFFAFFGAFLTTLLIYFIAEKCGGKKYTIVLAGIAVSSLFQALMKLFYVLYPDSMAASNDFLIGTLADVKMSGLWPSMIIILVCSFLSFLFSGKLNALSLGDKEASSLGVNVRAYRFVFIVLASLLASSVIAYAGLIGFVGLMVPHIARRIIGNNHFLLIPFSGMAGSVLVISCDLLTRVVFSPYEVPCGILIAILGVPFFIYLLLRRRNDD